MRIPTVPVSASSVAEWIRRGGETINRLIGVTGGLETRLAQAEADIEATDADLDALELEMDAAQADIVALQAFAAAPVNLQAVRVTARGVAGTPVIVDGDLAIGVDAGAGAVTVTLPPLAAHPGRVLLFRKLDAGANMVTIAGDGAETIDGAVTRALAAQWETVTLIAALTGWWAV